MNSLNTWCRIASLGCCLILGIEGFWFGHDVVTQARLLEPGPTLADQQHPALNQEMSRSVATR